MLGLYALVASGLPLAIPTAAGTAAARNLAGKDRSRPFPCMDKACGCDSAERCFSVCCCHTPAETLAWAKARGLEPAVIAALSRRVAAAKPAPAAGGCCARTAAANTAEDDTDNAICSDYQSLAAEPGLPLESPADDQPASRVVILRAMLACGGIVAQWAAVGVSLPPPAVVTCLIAWPCVGTVVVFDDGPSGAGGPPDLPPPRA
jgi:hypothetical protein